MKFDSAVIIAELEKRGANHPCHRCGNEDFSVLDGFSKYFIQDSTDNIGGLSVGGPVVPIFLVACTRCGAITSHALGALFPSAMEKKDVAK